jgi:hypothetical protein
MEPNFHHLENMSIYADVRDPKEPLPSIPEDDDSKPSSILQREENNYTQMMYMGLVGADSYDGTGDPIKWIMHYHSVASANLWDKKIMFYRLVSYLKGAPRAWYENERLLDPAFGWDQFEQGLIERYSNEFDTIFAKNQIINRRQGKDESFNSYWEEKLSLIRLNDPSMPISDQIVYLFHGLTPELTSKTVGKFLSKKPQNIKELYLLIKRAADSLTFVEFSNSLGQTEKSILKKKKLTGAEVEETAELKKLDSLLKAVNDLNNRLESMEAKANKWMPLQNEEIEEEVRHPSVSDPIQCNICGDYGHFDMECPKKPDFTHYSKN